MPNNAFADGLKQLGLLPQEGAVQPEGSDISMTDADSGFAPGYPKGFRLDGIDAPETAHESNNYTAEPMAYAARDELANMVEDAGGATLRDLGQTEYYNRGLAELIGEDNTNIGLELARTGLVNAPRYAPGQEYQDAFRGANWRTSTDAGDILTGEAAEVNQRVKTLQREVFAARQRGEMSPLFNPDYDKNQNYTSWDKSWTRGAHNAIGGLNMFAAAIGDVVGSDTMKQWGQDGARTRLQKAAAFPAEVQDWDDVKSWDAFGTFVVEKLGETLPQLGIDAVSMIGTGGTAVAARIGFAKALARELPADQLAKFGLNASKVGAAAGIYGQAAGETAAELYQSGVDNYGTTALLAGIPKAALEYAPLGYALRNFARVSGLPGSQIWNAAGQIAKTAGIEATTEGMQTVVDFMARKHHTGEDLFSAENIKELKTAIAAGAIIGGGFAGVAAVPPAYKALRDKYLNKNATTEPVVQTTTDGTPITTREGYDDLRAQIDRFADGSKNAVFISAADKDMYDVARAANPKAQFLLMDEGLLALNERIDGVRYMAASPKMREAMRQHAIGYTQSKDQVDLQKASVVQTKDAEGNVVHQEVTDIPETVIAKQEQNKQPGDVVEHRQLTDVITEREAKANANDAARTNTVESEQLLSDAILERQRDNPGSVGSQLPGPTGTVSRDSGQATAVPDQRIGSEVFLGSHGRPGTITRDALTGTTGGAPVQPDAFGGGGKRTVDSSDTNTNRDSTQVLDQVAPGDRGNLQALPANTGTSLSAVPEVAGATTTNTVGVSTGGSNSVDSVSRRTGLDEQSNTQSSGTSDDVRGDPDVATLPRVSMEHALANPELLVRALTDTGMKLLAQQLDQQGVARNEIPLYILAAYQIDNAPEPAIEQKTVSDVVPEVVPGAIEADAYDFDPNDLELPDEFVIDEVHESVHQPDDMDAQPSPADYRGEFFGRTLQDKIAAFNALYPTWTLATVLLPRKGAQRGQRFMLQPKKQVWDTEADAQLHSGLLESQHAGQIFLVNKGNDGFYLTRHLLTHGHSTSSPATPESTWVKTSLPKIVTNAGAAARNLEMISKSIKTGELSDDAVDNARSRLKEQFDRIVMATGVDPATGRLSRNLQLHAPTITALGRELVGQTPERNTLDYYYDAFAAGISALYSQGYVIQTPLKQDSEVIFTPTGQPYTIADVFQSRSGIAGRKSLMQRLESQYRDAKAKLNGLNAKLRDSSFTKGAFYEQLVNEAQTHTSVVQNLELALADTRNALLDQRGTQTIGDQNRDDYAQDVDTSIDDSDSSTEFNPDIDAVQYADGSESIENKTARAEQIWNNTPREYDEFGESTRIARSTLTRPATFRPAKVYNREHVLNKAQITVLVKKFLDEFPGLKGVKVDIQAHQTDLPSGFLKAAYHPAQDTVVIYADNVTSVQDVRASLLHELLVHKGLGVFNPEQRNTILKDLSKVVSTSPALAQAHKDIVAAYPDLDSVGQTEELLAVMAEYIGDDSAGSPQKNRVFSAVRNMLQTLKIIPNDAGKQQVEDVLLTIADALKKGDVPQTRKDIDVMHRRVLSAAIGRFSKTNGSELTQHAKAFGQGIKKLALPLMSGLYQLNELSTKAANDFRKYWAYRDSQRAAWEAMSQHQLQLDKQQFNSAWRELVDVGEEGDLSGVSPEAARLRKFIDTFFDKFAKPNLPTLGKIPNYVPQVYDITQIASRQDEVRQILSRFMPPGEIEGTIKAILSKGGAYEHSLEDYQGVVSPGTDHRHARMLRDPGLIAALDDGGFMFEDKQSALDNYLTTVINRGAFEKTFSGMRTVPGWLDHTGKYNIELITSLLKSAGRDDLLSQNLSAQQLYQKAREQGYADKVETTDLRGIPVQRIFADHHPSVGYQFLAKHAWRAGREDLLPPQSDIYNEGALNALYSRLRSESVRIPARGDLVTKEQLLWYSPTFELHKIRQDLAPTERKRMDEIVHGFMGYFSARVSPTVHRIQSNVMAYESVLTLAFSTLSSLPDFVGSFLRIMQTSGVSQALKQFKNAARTNDAGAKRLAREFGMLNHRQTAAALKSMWGQDHYSPHAQKVLDTLFKWNGQEVLTQMSRVFTLHVGSQYFSQMARDNNYDALAEFGVTPQQFRAWEAIGSPGYTLDTIEKGGFEAKLAEDIHAALHQFVDQSVIRPNAGQRPVWANDPRFALFWHLKTFLWSYWAVIISPTGRSIINQISKGKYGEAGAQLAFMGLMILPLAALGWEIRQLIQYSLFDEEQPNDRLDGFQYTAELLQRSGIAGPFQLAFDAIEQDSADKAAIRLAGPTMDHAWTLLNGDFDRKIYRSIPVLGQLYGAQQLISDNSY